jgi:hypothetical protein
MVWGGSKGCKSSNVPSPIHFDIHTAALHPTSSVKQPRRDGQFMQMQTEITCLMHPPCRVTGERFAGYAVLPTFLAANGSAVSRAPHRQYLSVFLSDGEVGETAVNITGCSSAVVGYKSSVFDILHRTPSWLIALSGRVLFPWLCRLGVDEVYSYWDLLKLAIQRWAIDSGWRLVQHVRSKQPTFTQVSTRAGQKPTETTTDGIVTITMYISPQTCQVDVRWPVPSPT